MAIGDKMRDYANQAQDGVKTSSLSFFHFIIRLVTGLLLGLVLSLIGQELIDYGTFALMFGTVVIMVAMIRLLSAWSLSKILIFDLICVLVAMLLRMYILVAP